MQVRTGVETAIFLSTPLRLVIRWLEQAMPLLPAHQACEGTTYHLVKTALVALYGTQSDCSQVPSPKSQDSPTSHPPRLAYHLLTTCLDLPILTAPFCTPCMSLSPVVGQSATLV